MNVTVFGATRGVGSQVVDQLRTRGHRTTAYVRDPSRVPSRWGEEATVVVGELSDPEAVDRAVQGADAIVSALWARAWTARPPDCLWSRAPATSSATARAQPGPVRGT